MYRNIILLICILPMFTQADTDYRSSLYQRLSQALQAGKQTPNTRSAEPGPRTSGERPPVRTNSDNREYWDTSDSASERRPDTDRTYDQRGWSSRIAGNSRETGHFTDDEDWWNQYGETSDSDREYDETEFGDRIQRNTRSERSSQLMEMLKQFRGGNGQRSSGGDHGSQLMEMLQQFRGGGNGDRSSGGDRSSQLMEMLQQWGGGNGDRSSGDDRSSQLIEMLQQFRGGNGQGSTGGDRNSQLMEILNRFGGGNGERGQEPQERNWRRAYARNTQRNRDDYQDEDDYTDRFSPFSSGRQSGSSRNMGFKNFLDRMVSMVGMESQIKRFMQPSGFLRF